MAHAGYQTLLPVLNLASTPLATEAILTQISERGVALHVGLTVS